MNTHPKIPFIENPPTSTLTRTLILAQNLMLTPIHIPDPALKGYKLPQDANKAAQTVMEDCVRGDQRRTHGAHLSRMLAEQSIQVRCVACLVLTLVLLLCEPPPQLWERVPYNPSPNHNPYPNSCHPHPDSTCFIQVLRERLPRHLLGDPTQGRSIFAPSHCLTFV